MGKTEENSEKAEIRMTKKRKTEKSQIGKV